MFGKIKNIAARLDSLTDDMILDYIMEDETLQAQIIDLNQKQLYEQGVESDGNSTGEYSLRTIAEKEAVGERYDHVTLHDTGEFYDSMKVEIGYNNIRITGDMQKPDRDLEEGWPKALGLTDESISEILPEVKERFIAAIRKAIAA